MKKIFLEIKIIEMVGDDSVAKQLKKGIDKSLKQMIEASPYIEGIRSWIETEKVK